MSVEIAVPVWRTRRSPYGPFGMRNCFSLGLELQTSLLSPLQYRLQQQFTEDLVLRLGLAYELKGHEGCVNCLSWNSEGSLLASGSDDCQIRIWQPLRRTCRHVIATGHTGNIFGVKFLPGSSDNLIISCAADGTVRLHDLNFAETTYVFTCHVNRAKRVATSPDSPFVFWSAGEDGLVIQYDLREPKRCNAQSCRNVLINLNPYVISPELKSIACNPVRTEQIVIGATDCYTRLYDRRKLTLTTLKYPNTMVDDNRGFIRRHTWLSSQTSDLASVVLPAGCVRYFAPGHLPVREAESHNPWKSFSVTDVRFSADGANILSNIGGEQIYLFEVNSQDKICKSFAIDEQSPLRKRNLKEPTGFAKKLKQTANEFYHKKSFTHAIETYDRALQYCPHASVLYANRSAALMNRKWDGDSYQAALDAHKACLLDPNNEKAQFRLIKALLQVRHLLEAKRWLDYFRSQQEKLQINQLESQSFREVEKNIMKALKSQKSAHGTPIIDTPFHQQEKLWRTNATDYEQRFVGHCNTTTDIKEANFVGDRGQYIMAGSDDGSFFIWDRESTNLLKVIRGDSNIVNCLEAHPTTCLIATSGIDDQVRIWAPQPVLHVDREEKNSYVSGESSGATIGSTVEDVGRATNDNQRRMHADPWSLIVGNWVQDNQGNAPAGGPLIINPAQECVQQ